MNLRDIVFSILIFFGFVTNSSAMNFGDGSNTFKVKFDQDLAQKLRKHRTMSTIEKQNATETNRFISGLWLPVTAYAVGMATYKMFYKEFYWGQPFFLGMWTSLFIGGGR